MHWTVSYDVNPAVDPTAVLSTRFSLSYPRTTFERNVNVGDGKFDNVALGQIHVVITLGIVQW